MNSRTEYIENRVRFWVEEPQRVESVHLQIKADEAGVGIGSRSLVQNTTGIADEVARLVAFKTITASS